MDDISSESTPAESTDSTSIKPVSSLRSRFENLQVGQSQPPTSPATPRHATSKTDLRPPSNDAQPASPSLRASLDMQRPKSFVGTPYRSTDHVDQLLQLKKRQPTPTKQRPISMFTQRSDPPSVNIESPTSPAQHLNVNLTSATPINRSSSPSAPTSINASPAPSVSHSRTPSRATTPALGARMSAFLQAADQNIDSEKRDVIPMQKLKPQHTAGPPPVNRAGKPKLTNLPALHIDSESLAPNLGTAPRDEISPFSTPPSSSDSASVDHLPPSVARNPKSRASMQFPQHQNYFPSITGQRFVPEPTHETLPKQLSRPTTTTTKSFESRSYPPPPSRLQTARPQIIIPAQDGTDEDLPNLPPRPPRNIQSGRTSPVRQQRIPARTSTDVLRRVSATPQDTAPPFEVPPRRTPQSALTQGFSTTTAPVAVSQKPLAPAIPAPRRSVDSRREDVNLVPATPIINRSADDYDDPPLVPHGGGIAPLTDFPDASQTNRRPPQFNSRPWEIGTGYDTKLFAVSGEFVCTTGYITRAWNLRTGEPCFTLAHAEGIKVSALAFKPTADVNEDGKRLWLGTSLGEIHEIDIPTQSVIQTKPNAHRREIVKLYRHASQIWSLDVEGEFHIWSAGKSGVPSLETIPRTFRTTRGHSASIIVGNKLWLASGKDVYIFQPNGRPEDSFQMFTQPLRQESAGEVTSAATISSKPDLIYFGHSDGKVSIYNKRDYTCVGLVNVSSYKIISLTGAGDYLWAGFSTGKIYVYDTSSTPWRVMKDWQAHDKAVSNIITDRQSLWRMDRLQVISLGHDNVLRIWDGLLEEDWLESRMQERDNEFCSFQEVSAAVLTWNAGATKPSYLRNDKTDNNFFRDYLSSHSPPDIFVFGFQELVDLEDKKVTASESLRHDTRKERTDLKLESFFKSKKKDPTEQEHMSHQYRAWRDHISRCIEDFMSADQSYTLLHTASMVGLFSCIFVKTSLRNRIKQVHASEVKRGMGGLHGNKVSRILLCLQEDESLTDV